jgi:hypothetical protein
MELLAQFLLAFAWGAVGAVTMAVSLAMLLKVFTWLTPVDEWAELRQGNVGVAIVVGAVVLAFGLVVGADSKLAAEQEAERMKFVLLKERQEAERKRVEASGIADFQRIVTQGISEPLLKWKAIEVAHDLSKSPNAKVVILGDKSGLPIILSEK